MKIAIAIIATFISSSTMAEMSLNEYYLRESQHNWYGELYPAKEQKPFFIKSPPKFYSEVTRAETNRQAVADEVKRQTEEKLGLKWVQTALRLSNLESGFNPKAINRRTRASGVLQVIPKSAIALGYDPRRLTETSYGISAGIAHMQACINYGVKTPAQMAACHVAGFVGWRRRLSKWAEHYKRQYVRMVMR